MNTKTIKERKVFCFVFLVVSWGGRTDFREKLLIFPPERDMRIVQLQPSP